MDRTPVIAIAILVAAVALFALKLWSDHGSSSNEPLLAGGRYGPGDVAAVPKEAGVDSPEGGWSGSEARSGGRRTEGGSSAGGRSGQVVSETGRGAGGGGTASGGTSGSAQTLRSGGTKGGGTVGYSGSSRPGSAATGGSVGVIDDASKGRLSARAQPREDLVEFIGSQAPTQADLAQPPGNGEDVALKVESPDDIAKQAGQDVDVHDPDDGGDGIKITDRGRIEFPNYANGDAGTISFQLQPDWAGTDQSDNALLQIRQEHQWNDRLELVKNGEFLRFIVTDNTGREADISVRISDWQSGDQHDIRASWGEGRTSLYIDGRLVGSNTYSGTLQFAAGTPMFLGADYPGSSYAGANATIREFTLSNSASHD